MEELYYLSSNLKALRRSKNLSQTELAKKLNMTRNKIASYEGRQTEPRLSVLMKFAEFFEVPLDAILRKDLADARELVNAHDQNLERDKTASPTADWKSNGSKIDLEDPGILEEFITKNQQIARMVEDYKTFDNIRALSKDPKHAKQRLISAENLLYLLEHILETNQVLIKRLQER